MEKNDERGVSTDSQEQVLLIPMEMDTLLKMHSASVTPGSGPHLNVRVILRAFFESKYVVLGWVLGMASLLLAMSFFQPRIYQADVTFVPADSNLGTRLQNLLPMLGGIIPELDPGRSKNTAGKLAIVLKSRRMARQMIEKFPELKALLRPEPFFSSPQMPNMEEYSLALIDCLTVTLPRLDHQPMILSVELANATMAAQVANEYMVALNSFVNENSFTTAQSSREFIETQLAHHQKELALAEESLRTFQEQHQLVSLEPGILSVPARASGSVEVQRLASRLAQLHKQFERLESLFPGLSTLFLSGESPFEGMQVLSPPSTSNPAPLELFRRKRDVEVAQKVYGLLKEQVTLARINEKKESISFNVIDSAYIPWQKIRPRRLVYVLFGALLGLLASAFSLRKHFLMGEENANRA